MALKNKLPRWTTACSTLELCSHSMCSYIFAQGQEYFAVILKTLKNGSKGDVKNSKSQHTKHFNQHSRGVKLEWDMRNQNGLGMYTFSLLRNIISKINTHYFNGIKYVPICLTWFTILVSFPDEFAIELTVVCHHPELLSSSVLR